MAPETLNAIDSKELIEKAKNIREWQLAKGWSDEILVKKFSSLGSVRTFSRILGGDLAQMDIERQLANYRSAWMLIESVNDGENDEEKFFDDFSGPIAFRKAFVEVIRERGNARVIVVEADTGMGKTGIRKTAVEKYGQRVLCIEADVVWKDNPSALLAAILRALGRRDIPHLPEQRKELVIELLNEIRVMIFIEEAHHMGPRCLNLCKTLINRTRVEFCLLAMATLWKKLEQGAAYEECRQLTGNRLAERVRLKLKETDIRKFVERCATAFGEPRDITQAVKILFDRAPSRGNMAFVREVCKRLRELEVDKLTLEQFGAAVSAEMESR